MAIRLEAGRHLVHTDRSSTGSTWLIFKDFRPLPIATEVTAPVALPAKRDIAQLEKTSRCPSPMAGRQCYAPNLHPITRARTAAAASTPIPTSCR